MIGGASGRADPQVGTLGWRQVVSPWLLAIAGGGVDAVVLLGFNVLTAAQTGNTILLAVALARGDAVGGTSAALSVLAFLFGVSLGALLLARGAANRAPALPTLLIEALLLLGLLGFWIGVKPLDRHEALGVIALAALAMGLQSALALHLRGPTTTYMTGTLTAFGTGLVERLQARRRASRGAALDQAGGQPAGTSPWRSGLTWLLYLTSAIGCGVLFLHFDVLALLVPAAAVGLVVLLQLQTDAPVSKQARRSG
ncbi:MAG: DUF1275 domain-containing protein [Thiohalocapsa sp.]|uniref:DUF1275 family protein n=1 Tax=Thiohalocapsa sp. TaxID=2497641 RepID=UPI0025FDBA9C|nr:YoaK family protein [Thiohalocapsa sp.]MCG6940913.1 DUF1275 domain-containing protein [Thiohalocapsa sp.]